MPAKRHLNRTARRVMAVLRPLKVVFCADRRDSKPGALVFNRTVTLRDEWTKLVSAGRENK